MIEEDEKKVTPIIGRFDAEETIVKSWVEDDVLLAIKLLKDKGIIPYDFDHKTHYLIDIYEE